MILHIDMDAFFASVEQAANPALAGKPVLVGGPTGRGVMVAASYEAKGWGVKTGMPMAQARRLCPAAVVVRGDPDKYVDVSRRLVRLIAAFTPRIEPYSVDEMFLDLAGTAWDADPRETGLALKRAVRRDLGLPCTVGIGPNRFLAKMATRFDKPDGLFLLRKEDVPVHLHPLPVDALWGIGTRTSEALDRLGIRTVGQLAAFPVRLLTDHFGVIGEALSALARGEDDSPVGAFNDEPNRSMSHAHTLSRDATDARTVRRVLLGLCDKLTRRMRSDRYAGRTVVLTVRWADFETVQRHLSLPEPVDVDLAVYAAAVSLWNILAAGAPGGTGVPAPLPPPRPVRLLGVGVANLIHRSGPRQACLGEAEGPRRALVAADRVRDRFGEQSILRGAMLICRQERDATRYERARAVHFQTARKFGAGPEATPAP